MNVNEEWVRLNGAFWALWSLYWLVSARSVNKTKSSESQTSRFLHLAPTLLVFLMIFTPLFNFSFLAKSLFSETHIHHIIGIFLTALGLGFTVWARVHLGRYWSAIVTVKENHKLIRSGPYKLARHPIYTGFICAVLGSAITQGKVSGLVAFVITVATYLRKLLVEERILKAQFGEEYLAFSREVKALIPFIL